jgi:mannose-6-phosphate isomerase-like protein (cupin superfamily)
MVRRRDVLVAGATLAASLGTPRASEPAEEVMGSSTFDWNKLDVRKTNVGESRKVCQAPTATLDELECHITTLNPGERPHPPHKHADEEVVVLREGTLEVTLGDRTETVGPGSVIFQASNQMHSVRNVGTTPAIYTVIKWNSPGMLKKK